MGTTPPHAAASGTAPQQSQPTLIGETPIQARTPPNEDPASKEGTRAKERAQQRHQPAEAANRTHQGDERARPRQGTRPRGPGSVLPHQHPTGSTRVAATPTARAHRRNTEAVHVPPNFAQVTWLDNGVPPTFPPSLPLQAYSQMLCLYRGSGRWDLRILSTSPDAEPFLAQGIYPQSALCTGAHQTRTMVPRGCGACSNAPRGRYPRKQATVGPDQLAHAGRVAHTSRPNAKKSAWGTGHPREVELRRGDSFLIIWEDEGWTLFERYPGDVAAWTTTVMPEGTEVSHHNHILLPTQQVYDGDTPPGSGPQRKQQPSKGTPQRGEHPPQGSTTPAPEQQHQLGKPQRKSLGKR